MVLGRGDIRKNVTKMSPPPCLTLMERNGKMTTIQIQNDITFSLRQVRLLLEYFGEP